MQESVNIGTQPTTQRANDELPAPLLATRPCFSLAAGLAGVDGGSGPCAKPPLQRTTDVAAKSPTARRVKAAETPARATTAPPIGGPTTCETRVMPPNRLLARPRMAGAVISRTRDERPMVKMASPTPMSVRAAVKSRSERVRQASAASSDAAPLRTWPVASVSRAPRRL